MRLDSYLLQNKYYDSRTKAQQAIERGEISLNGRLIKKSSFSVDENLPQDVEIKQCETFVSLGGYKLEKALKDFDFDVSGLTVADFGASTGGFTDCLIKRGASKVFALDLNDGLLHYSLKNNPKVIPVIKNAKEITLSDFDCKLDLITADLSFISATKILQIMSDIIEKGKQIILLIKPQFESEQRVKYKNGIIRDKKVVKNACKKIYDFALSCDLSPIKATVAPTYEDKNTEFLLLLKKGKETVPPFEKLFSSCF